MLYPLSYGGVKRRELYHCGLAGGIQALKQVFEPCQYCRKIRQLLMFRRMMNRADKPLQTQPD